MRVSRKQTVFTGVHDIFISRPINGANSIVITTDCGGAAEDGLPEKAIPDGTVVKLRRKAVSQFVSAFTDSGGECTQNTFDISPALARKFGIVNNTRYTVTTTAVHGRGRCAENR
ncbi:hypothetical protein ACFPVX_09515 [Cohnella faecalis]|uniref:Uncharacterized protein n=1 Tax=Cohnella faecalis TaxID=2315694 RepID=A0A398CQ21_9BACL|nr:hypothetical protein [Cohnella faecalis]RIE01937.1 hypothetical protein D3H35_14280 [Cohnella faecalis]